MDDPRQTATRPVDTWGDSSAPSTGGMARGGIIDRMLSRGWEFDFFQAAWLLERARPPGRELVGARGPVAQEWVRFRPDVMLGFPPTDVRRIRQRYDEYGEPELVQVDVTFMGLYGVATPLPLHYAVDILRAVNRAAQAPAPTALEQAEAAAARDRVARRPDEPTADDPMAANCPTRDFLDVFHHRLISLFYRAGIKYRFDRTFGIPGRDDITTYVSLLIGCPRAFTFLVLGVPPIRLLRYAGVLTQHPRSALTLEGVLRDYWKDIDFRVQQFIGRWVPLNPHDMTRMGMMNSSLGVDMTVGEQVFDLGGCFNITVGPVDWTTYVSFLPDGHRYQQTRALTRLYCQDPLAFNIEIRLLPGQVPVSQLGSGEGACRLGYTSWVHTGGVGETGVLFDATLPLPSTASSESM